MAWIFNVAMHMSEIYLFSLSLIIAYLQKNMTKKWGNMNHFIHVGFLLTNTVFFTLFSTPLILCICQI